MRWLCSQLLENVCYLIRRRVPICIMTAAHTEKRIRERRLKDRLKTDVNG